MTNETIDRRLLLRGAGVAGATALGTTALASSASARGRERDHDDHDDHDHDHDDVVGAWVIRHRDDPPGDTTDVTAVVTFSEGGTMMVQDINPVSPSGAGAWREGRRGFRARFWTGFRGENPGDPGGTVDVQLRGRTDDDEVKGRFRFTAYDATTGAELGRGTGTFDGERLEA